MTHTAEAAETLHVSLEEAVSVTRKESAKNTVKAHIIAGMAVGLVPVPAVDMVALIGVQLKMLHSLCKTYDVPFKENLGKSLISSLIGGSIPAAATITLASVAKLIPGIGTLAGGASVSVLSGALTFAVGRVFIYHFEKKGTLADFDPAAYRDMFKSAFAEGKGVAADAEKSADAAV